MDQHQPPVLLATHCNLCKHAFVGDSDMYRDPKGTIIRFVVDHRAAAARPICKYCYDRLKSKR